jgi:hypothetical protein
MATTAPAQRPDLGPEGGEHHQPGHDDQHYQGDVAAAAAGCGCGPAGASRPSRDRRQPAPWRAHCRPEHAARSRSGQARGRSRTARTALASRVPTSAVSSAMAASWIGGDQLMAPGRRAPSAKASTAPMSGRCPRPRRQRAPDLREVGGQRGDGLDDPLEVPAACSERLARTEAPLVPGSFGDGASVCP